MTDADRAASSSGAGAGPRRRRVAPAFRRVLLVLLALLGPCPLPAHEIVDPDTVRTIVALTDTAAARVKSAAGSLAQAEAMFALGTAQVEATAILNRDLAAHNGKLTFHGETLQKELDQRHLAPAFDDAIGRYRLPRASLEQASSFAPQTPQALRARFELLKAGFYESFVLDPFQLVGMSVDDLDRQIAEAEALAAIAANADDAEEAAFIHAVDLARAARLSTNPDAARAYADKARVALAAFAKSYPESLRAASAALILKTLGEQ
jgi:hypothetical protein